MTREIKFRGKSIADIDRGEWVYGYLFNVEGEVAYIWNGVPHEVPADTVGQYTGLKDRDGREIYEGDIITAVMYDDEFDLFWVDFQVIWKSMRLCIECLDDGEIEELEYLTENEAEILVKGNIHDNPELLEDRK